ncbi:hypothetical protein A6A04_00290 [Paramagnetospirillum marisnigri]|uniref:CopC domain-containing protein n=1 Tax=Paramagnetospirillum marisnigri TaxID=1285242 RepID=A0A178MRG5_9PROT|nr:copper resistance CopC family protein [Paramagnetospirillum marisnigri]OAN52181.1 hypothetical protein A6A04_00290 [Paramagnetospirillum marisnigri]
MSRLLLSCVAVAIGLLMASPVRAHAVLVDSQPNAKATVVGEAVEFVLRYNSRVDARRSRLVLKGPGGESVLEVRQGKTEADLAATAAKLAPGTYQLLWDVLSVDGHVSRGKVPFTAKER